MLREKEGRYHTQSHLNNYLLPSLLPFMHMSSMDQREEKSAHITNGQVAPHRLPNLKTDRLTDCKFVFFV